MENMIRKLTSRKLWLAIVCIAAGLAMVFMDIEASEIVEIVKTVSGVFTMLGGTALFNIPESKVDAAREEANRRVDVNFPESCLDKDESGE